MPQYSKGDEKKYFPTVIAALIIAAIAISGFIYSMVKGQDDAKIGQPFDEKPGIVKLSPGSNTPTPKTAPSVPSPTTPPPSN